MGNDALIGSLIGAAVVIAGSLFTIIWQAASLTTTVKSSLIETRGYIKTHSELHEKIEKDSEHVNNRLNGHDVEIAVIKRIKPDDDTRGHWNQHHG